MKRQILHFQNLSFLADLTQEIFTCLKVNNRIEKGAAYI